MEKLILSCAMTGTATTKSMAPAVPEMPEEIAEDVVRVAKAGASIVHIHVRDENNIPTMRADRYEQTFLAIKRATEAAGVDVVVNLTSSGSPKLETTETRTAPLRLLRPEMCSFDSGTFNWHYSSIFINPPDFLHELSLCAVENDIKPEFEIFDCGMLVNAIHYIETCHIPQPCHFQFVLGVGGAMEATTKNLCFLVDMLPPGSTWSVTGIGKGHLNMMLAGLSMNCPGIRVGLEDNIYLSRGVKATNLQLVERAVKLAQIAGREIATPEEARKILGITRHSLAEYNPA